MLLRSAAIPHRQNRPYWRQPCALLLIALCLSILLYPLAHENHDGRILLMLIDQALIQIAIRAVGHSKASWRAGLLFGLLSLAAQITWLIEPNTHTQILSHVGLLVFYAHAVYVFIAYVNYDDVATMDEMFACACLYLLFAFLWSHAYAILLALDPSALYINDANNPDGVITYFESLYFSFTTITSVGFGEITPVSSWARAIVILQQLTGVLFLAIVVARLLSLMNRRRGD
ncbi:MAG: hypothetical protein IPK97_07360 [Ahniella sp.]|nr:hypothetical protein [Ahniella sp.]